MPPDGAEHGVLPTRETVLRVMQDLKDLNQGLEDYGIDYIDEQDEDEREDPAAQAQDEGKENVEGDDETEKNWNAPNANSVKDVGFNPKKLSEHLLTQLNIATGGAAVGNKKKQKKKSKGKKKAKDNALNGQTGFEEGFTETSIGEADFTAIENLGARIELGCSKYRQSRKLDETRMSVLDSFLNWGGLRTGQNQFQGDRQSQSQAEDRDETQEAVSQKDVLPFNTDDDHDMVFDMETVVQSYLSQYIFQRHSKRVADKVLPARVVSNFINYFQVRKIFWEPEYQASLAAASKMAKKAEKTIPLIYDLNYGLDTDRYIRAAKIVVKQACPFTAENTFPRERDPGDMTEEEAHELFRRLCGGDPSKSTLHRKECSVRLLREVRIGHLKNGAPFCTLVLGRHNQACFAKPLPCYFVDDKLRVCYEDNFPLDETIEVACDFALADKAQLGSILAGSFLEILTEDDSGDVLKIWTIMIAQALPDYYMELEVSDEDDNDDDLM